MTSLLPYDGLRVREHFGSAAGGYITTTYGIDRSGTKTYRFNSLGFRGEEPSATAKARIFVCGCSQAFGTGLDSEEMWPSRFRDRVATSWNVAPEAIDLQNFSQGGASNCYITRMLISQSARIRPDLVLALFTHKARYELHDHERTVYVMPTWVNMYMNTEWAERVEHSWLGMSDDDVAMLYIKNVLLLQSYCQAHRIAFLFGSIENVVNPGFFEEIRTPVIAPLLSTIDFDLLVPLNESMWVDKAADDHHPGPVSQDLMAQAFWRSYLKKYGQLTLPEHLCQQSD